MSAYGFRTVMSVCHHHNERMGDDFLHFTPLFNYDHEQLNKWQSVIELSI